MTVIIIVINKRFFKFCGILHDFYSREKSALVGKSLNLADASTTEGAIFCFQIHLNYLHIMIINLGVLLSTFLPVSPCKLEYLVHITPYLILRNTPRKLTRNHVVPCDVMSVALVEDRSVFYLNAKKNEKSVK